MPVPPRLRVSLAAESSAWQQCQCIGSALAVHWQCFTAKPFRFCNALPLWFFGLLFLREYGCASVSVIGTRPGFAPPQVLEPLPQWIVFTLFHLPKKQATLHNSDYANSITPLSH
jgi:hypothetical protein